MKHIMRPRQAQKLAELDRQISSLDALAQTGRGAGDGDIMDAVHALMAPICCCAHGLHNICKLHAPRDGNAHLEAAALGEMLGGGMGPGGDGLKLIPGRPHQVKCDDDLKQSAFALMEDKQAARDCMDP
jgi:hypothetical protein